MGISHNQVDVVFFKEKIIRIYLLLLIATNAFCQFSLVFLNKLDLIENWRKIYNAFIQKSDQISKTVIYSVCEFMMILFLLLSLWNVERSNACLLILIVFLLYCAILVPIVLFSYFKVEKIEEYAHIAKITLFAICFFSGAFSFSIWTRAGIVRDIPELEIDKSVIDRRKFPHYVDRIFDYNHDYTTTDTNVLF